MGFDRSEHHRGNTATPPIKENKKAGRVGKWEEGGRVRREDRREDRREERRGEVDKGEERRGEVGRSALERKSI